MAANPLGSIASRMFPRPFCRSRKLPDPAADGLRWPKQPLTSLGEVVSRRQIYIGIFGLILGFVGLAALWFPVYLDQFDAYGMQINCGNGIGTHVALAHAGGDAAASQCGTAMLVRRAWAIPAVAIGGLMVVWFVLRWVRGQEEREQDPRRPLDPRGVPAQPG